MKTFACFLTLAMLAVPSAHADDKVIVHEWGTFTCLQDERGQAIGGINVDDEPVPPFVLGIGHVRNLSGQSSNGEFGLPPFNTFSKGWNPADQDVTMRLETPVLYIYPPQRQAAATVPPLDVHVDFHQGVLSQFYPYAETNGVPDWSVDWVKWMVNGHISGLTTGLTWKAVRIGSTDTPVDSQDAVWTTPREVSAPVLEVQHPIYNAPGSNGVTYGPQAEHFLFYRGIGQLDSPLSVLTLNKGMYCVCAHSAEATSINAAWVVEIRANGTAASRAVTQGNSVVDNERPNTKPVFSTVTTTRLHGSFLSGSGTPVANVSAAFSESDFSADNLAILKISMHDALVKEGLYDDEATAMLKTWELSYFKSPGLRFFYIVPRAWTDKVLPLKITGAPTDITRVMVGRIKLISEAQKLTLARLSVGPCPNIMALREQAADAVQKSNLPEAEKNAIYNDDQALGKLGIYVPPLVQDYLSLGRFRDPLIVHEQAQHPSAVLAQFIKDNRLTSGN